MCTLTAEFVLGAAVYETKLTGNGPLPVRARASASRRRRQQDHCCEQRELDYFVGMDWQQLASLFIVAATVMAFWRTKRRSPKTRGGCDSLCGCSSVGRDTPQTLIFRGRKGERSQVLVKMG